MKSIGESSGNYLQELARKSKKSGISQSFQAIGYEIAVILHDLSHKALYIKLAKTKDPQQLLGLAKTILDKKDISNPGAYFMKLQKEIPTLKQ